MLEQMLWACILALVGSVVSHSAIWYKIGALEKAVYNGNGKKCPHNMNLTKDTGKKTGKPY